MNGITVRPHLFKQHKSRTAPGITGLSNYRYSLKQLVTKGNHMSNFTPAEIEYLNSQRLGRLATVNSEGEPHVVPVGFRYNPALDTIDIGGRNIAQTRKFRDAARYGRVAFVVDDVLPPWKPRGIEIRGRAEVLPSGGQEIVASFAPDLIRVHPTRIIGWGLEGDSYHRSSRTIA
jgi:pyridoxamine 5'-phosphate oxidase family protein